MIHSPKLLWGEGLFLRPQHFQRQDAYHEWRLSQTARMLHPYAWGVRHLKLDTDALQAGVLRVLELQAVFPDGELYSAPGEDDLPPPVSLESLPGASTETVFHLAIAPLRSVGSNFATEQENTDSGVRYFQRNEKAPDWYTDAVEAEVAVLRKCPRLVAEHEPRDHLVSLPALRLRRTSTGSFEVDGRFMPPCVTLQSSPALNLMLRRLLDVLQAKVDALYGFHREPSKNIIEFRSGDVASFWLLHTASSSFASLSHLLRHPGLHPERLFQNLLELAGALMTFSKGYTLADLPTYEHGNPGPAFARLDHIIRELLETVISTRYFSIALSETKPSFHLGRLDSEQLTPSTHLYLGVGAAMPPAELVESVPMRFKLGAPDDVDKLVLSAMPGVRLVHAPQVPAAIPVRPGSYYFTLEPRGALYERMLQAQAVSIYVPQGWSELKLELIAVNS
ncbi:type VI secretion system baseplate subunit TssK [Schlegelella sp. S2-27]|uniref:Type VI secretion system baseplate subunit TssK n=1 Tax=Caldimonas mangrovi TaxID=2944811 RepID=A0ABT0YM52_9BURK|nr:type VI secretion system baseplate subunit TssK [Caldimonas mangrovi]MCM5679809.1 type VI secretion system baseplate subunit TssK [Caldimonas mangrovi]